MRVMEVLEILDSRGIPYVPRGDNEYAIVCLNAENHQGGFDSKPSLNINVEKLQAFCFSCGFSMSETGLTRWLIGGELEDLSLQTMALRAKINRLKLEETKDLSEARQIFIPPGEPWQEDGYRGISLDTYQKLGAINCTRGFYSDRIVFPVYLRGELIGVDARALLEGMQPKYQRNKGSLVKSTWLYPYDLICENKPEYVILCEGIFDAINLVDKGFDGLCFFGTNNFGLTKLRLLLATGCSEVILFLDKDEAGQEAQKRIGSMLSDWLQVTEAYTDHLKIKPIDSLAKGKLVYQDCGELTREEILEAVENRTKFK